MSALVRRRSTLLFYDTGVVAATGGAHEDSLRMMLNDGVPGVCLALKTFGAHAHAPLQILVESETIEDTLPKGIARRASLVEKIRDCWQRCRIVLS